MTVVSYGLPTTNAAMPNANELRRLREFVLAEHRWLRDDNDRRSQSTIEREFQRSFWAVQHFWRTPAPNAKRYISGFVDNANAMLGLANLPSIDGSEFVISCLAVGDVHWQKPDRSVGALLEVGLDQFRGAPCSNRWRSILGGSPLLKPTPPPKREQFAGPQPKIWRVDQSGLYEDGSYRGQW